MLLSIFNFNLRSSSSSSSASNSAARIDRESSPSPSSPAESPAASVAVKRSENLQQMNKIDDDQSQRKKVATIKMKKNTPRIALEFDGVHGFEFVVPY